MARSGLTRDRRRGSPGTRVPAARGAGAVTPEPAERNVLEEAAGAVGEEVRHLLEIEEKGDSPATPAIVILLVFLALLAVVAVELIIAFAFYLGWL